MRRKVSREMGIIRNSDSNVCGNFGHNTTFSCGDDVSRVDAADSSDVGPSYVDGQPDVATVSTNMSEVPLSEERTVEQPEAVVDDRQYLSDPSCIHAETADCFGFRR